MLLSEPSNNDDGQNEAATWRWTTLDFETFAVEWNNVFANGDFILQNTWKLRAVLYYQLL